jgi:hypothetical protein
MAHEFRGFVSSLTDLFALVAVGVFIAAAAVRSIVSSMDGNSRTKCASNLRQIGQSIQIYANDHRGQFPRTLFDMTANPAPTQYTGVNASDPFGPGAPGPNDVTAPMYLLLRTGGITGEVFICPIMQDSKVTPWVPPGGASIASFSNFPSRANLTYGYTNPYPTQAARSLGYKLNYTLTSDFAIAADMAPGPVVATVASDASRKQMVTANSPNHRGEGQNVLHADGHVDWNATIFCGAPRPTTNAPRDNIYAFGVDMNWSASSAGTNGAPQDQYDSVILPMANLGPQPGPLPTPLAVAEERAWLVAAIVVVVLATGLGVIWITFLRKKFPKQSAPASS